MKPKTTLFFLCIAILLFVFIKFYGSKHPGTREAAYLAHYALHFDPQKINKIEITNREGKIILKKTDTVWEMESPVKDPANAAAISKLLATAQSLPKQIVDEGSDAKKLLKESGLKKSKITLKLIGEKTAPTLILGEETAVKGKIYAKLADSKNIFIVSDVLKNEITQKTSNFRDQKLTELTVGQIDKFNIKTAAGEIEISRNHQNQWQIQKPIKARGDSSKITDTLANLLNTSIADFVANGSANLDAYGLSAPHSAITFTAEGSDKPVVLQFGSVVPKKKNEFYARLSTRDSVFALPDSAEKILKTKLNDLRDRHLMTLNLDTVDRIHIAPAGKPEMLLGRKVDGWQLLGKQNESVNREAVKNMINHLERDPITAFVSNVASNLAQYGLDKPSLKITFSSYASDTTAESKVGDEPLLTLDFGETKGNIIYARQEGEPFIVSINKSILENIPETVTEWQPLRVFKYKASDITSLTVISHNAKNAKSEKPLHFSRSEKSGWTLSDHKIVNKINTQSLVNTLATLRAVRWTDLSEKAAGISNPLTTIIFTTNDKKTHKLRIGAPTAGEMWNAAASSQPGVFVISRPDYEAFQLPLTAKPVAKKSAPNPVAPSKPAAAK